MREKNQKNPIFNKDLPAYEVIEVIGSGASAVVYKAIQKSLARPVAIKRFSPEKVYPDSDLRERFDREAQIWAHLSHENLLHLYDYISTKSAGYLVIEYCHGMDLRSLLDKSLRLPLEVSLALSVQLLAGLAYLHGQDVIHRDIKPANVYIRSDGTVKIMDFGVSTHFQFDTMTMSGTVIGTPAYMSPEQAMGKKASVQSDLFSFGVLVFELLEGFKPFTASKWEQLLKEVASGKHLKLSRRFPLGIRRIIHRCLKKNPKKRPASASDLKTYFEKQLQKRSKKNPQLILKEYLSHHQLIDTDALEVSGKGRPITQGKDQNSASRRRSLRMILLVLLLSALLFYAVRSPYAHEFLIESVGFLKRFFSKIPTAY